jgi:5-methylcytosine-specific restriction endonuclease McrA
MARKNREDFDSSHKAPEAAVCALCGRVILAGEEDAHHLVPKSKGGRQTVLLHRVCHDQIHAIFTNSQLAKTFSTIEAILENPDIQKFVAWIKSKPPGFSGSAKESQQGRGRR